MIDQVVIGVCGVASVYCSQSETRSVRRWACLFGIFAQPFWFYTTAVSQQWGIFALSFIYTYGWWRGIRLYWFKAAA